MTVKRLLPLFLMLALLFSACNIAEIDEIDRETLSADAPQPDNSSFGVAFASNESADPYTTTNKLNSELIRLITEPLFSVSADFEARPELCSEYTYSDKTYVFTIKKGVTFSDGSPLTADDVAASLRAATESSSFYSNTLSIIESISSSKKAGTVTVRLKYDNARFTRLLDIPIIKEGTRGEMLPVGTGLFAPKDDFSSLVKRESHHSGRTTPYSVISLTDVASTDELLFEFDNHTVSLLTSDPTASSPLTPLSASEITNICTTRLHYLGFNMRKAVFADPALRLSIARAIDRESIAKNDFAMMGTPSALPLHPFSSSFPSEIAGNLTYDGNLRIELSEPLEILVNAETSGKLAVCKRISETLTRLGAPCTVRALPFNEYVSALSRGDFDLYYSEVSLGADFDLTRLLQGPLNYGAFYDSELLALHSAYLAGDEARDDFFRLFCKKLPFIPIMFKNTAMYTQPGFFEKSSPTPQNTYNDFFDWKPVNYN